MAAKTSGSQDFGRPLTPDEIKDLVQLVSKAGVEELEVECGDFRLRIVGKSAPQQVIGSMPPQQMLPATGEMVVMQSSPAEETKSAGAAATKEEEETGELVKSPMVGTFYRSAAPDSPPFVLVGDRVDANTVLCIVEAMKLMNEIKAELSGTVRRILVENGQPVEYGQPLFSIEPA